MGVRKVVRGVGVLAALCALGVVVARADARLRHEAPVVDPAAELVYLPDARLLRPLVLGFDNVLADILWFRTINYFGQHYDSDRAYPWLARMCDLVTDLDPRAEHVYRFAGLILPWEAKEEDEGIRLLQKGVRALPESSILHFFLGITLYFFKDDYAAAAEELRLAAQLPNAPRGVAHMAAVLHARASGAETTIAFLREMYEQSDDPQLRRVIGRSLREAQVAADVERLSALVETYRERFGSPPASLDELVRARLLASVPRDPFGGVYRIDPSSGEIRSSAKRQPRRLQLRASPMKEWRERQQMSP